MPPSSLQSGLTQEYRIRGSCGPRSFLKDKNADRSRMLGDPRNPVFHLGLSSPDNFEYLTNRSNVR